MSDATQVPAFLYGTAWKEDATRELVERALDAGFRGIDTANQRKHYHEAAVGEALRAARDAGVASRDELFIQTKYTFERGQDHRLPYDPRAPIAEQVAQSFESSRAHLGVDVIDSYVLHGPTLRRGLADADLEAWGAMEALHSQGRARVLGVSNVSADQLEELAAFSKVRPTFVQNRCYARLGWDHAVRAVCARFGIIYQGFSLLTANAEELARPAVRAIAERHGCTVPQVVFRFALALGMLPLTGTSDREHMAQDLAAADIALEDEELEIIARCGLR